MLTNHIIRFTSAMKLLIVFSVVLTPCLSHDVVLIPEDNSHYIKDKSRFIWFPDGHGVPQLVDLHASVGDVILRYRLSTDIQYWLYTRRNPYEPQILLHGKITSIWKSNYEASKPIMVIVHGWKGDGNSDLNPLITSAYLAVQDANVIVVDWRVLADSNYVTATKGAPVIGYFVGDFLTWLFKRVGGDWNEVHLVGFSLGAHIVGNAGRTVGARPRRVTGLDPAGPLWSDLSKGISRSSGQYVEVIHTDGDRLGIFEPIGDADFYPNGGQGPQPGCRSSSCSHARAPELFASSVRHNHLVGRRCANISQIEEDMQCFGDYFNMGNSDLEKRGRGIYSVNTDVAWPF